MGSKEGAFRLIIPEKRGGKKSCGKAAWKRGLRWKIIATKVWAREKSRRKKERDREERDRNVSVNQY